MPQKPPPNDPLAPPTTSNNDGANQSAAHNNDTAAAAGEVQALVSHQPVGMELQVHDVVALEVFARQRPWASASRQPTLPPLHLLTAIKCCSACLLTECQLLSSSNNTSANEACV